MQKINKRNRLLNFFCAVILSFLFAGCKKDSPVPRDVSLGTISVYIDGTIKPFNTTAKAIQVSTTSPYQIRIEGYKQPGISTRMELTIYSPNPIVPGTYTENNAAGIHVHIVYSVDNIIVLTPHDSWGVNIFGISTRPGSVTISEISASFVKGSFYGTLFYDDISGTAQTNNLQDGLFYVSF
jgi:hypothetical protein